MSTPDHDRAESSSSVVAVPPEAWLPARRVYVRVMSPIARFLHVQSASGIVLIFAALLALLWANSPFHESYEHLWHTPIGFNVGGVSFVRDLHFWINDGLMTIFFFVVGAEIKREIVEGDLSDLRRASLPIAAAIGGMICPALLYFALNPAGPESNGWGVPMATDIAFAVGVLTLLGDRVPAALRILLLALAIIDDIGAILVIAVFYSTGFDINGLFIAVGGLALLFGLRKLGVRPGLLYVAPLLTMWTGCLMMGVHPTIAGVIAGLSVPVKPWFSRRQFIRSAEDAVEIFRANERGEVDDVELAKTVAELSAAGREAVSPALQAQHNFHGLVAFFIMPLFALANAGVGLGGLELNRGDSFTILLGVTIGLGLGKPLGIVGFSLLGSKLGLCRLPRGVDFRGLLLVGLVGGMGFTMSIFIAGLAYTDPGQLAVAKLAVLLGTGVTGIAGYFFGRFVCGPLAPEVQRISLEQAESMADV